MKKIGLPFKNCILKSYPEGSVTQWFTENPSLYANICYMVEGEKVCLQGHNGIDLVSGYGTDILAVEDCTVTACKNEPDGYGRHIRTLSKKADERGIKYECTYGHLSAINVNLYQEVKKGDVIGKMGNSGFVVSGSTPYWKYNPYAGTHLHLTVRESKKGLILNWPGKYLGAIDPLPLFEEPEPATPPTPEEVEVEQKISLMKTVVELLSRLLELLKRK